MGEPMKPTGPKEVQMIKAECVSCGSDIVEVLLIDEFNEVWCQICWDNLPEDEKEDAETRAYASEGLIAEESIND